jgi:DNA-binding NarL/FixJ family response regulator
LRILLVDDNPLFRDLIRRFVEDAGAGEIVADVALAEEAASGVAEHRPDVVIMDWSLPDRDGIWATREIKVRFPAVDVLALTSSNEQRVLDEFESAGATALFDKGDLDDLVAWLVEHPAPS